MKLSIPSGSDFWFVNHHIHGKIDIQGVCHFKLSMSVLTMGRIVVLAMWTTEKYVYYARVLYRVGRCQRQRG
jgi:hypothetical protein